MKYTQFDLLATVKNIDGTDAKVLNSDQTAVVSFTIKDAFRRALNGSYADEQPSQGNPGISFEEKLKRFDLIKKIWNAEADVELTTEEIAEIKKCVKKYFLVPEVVGFICEVIESK